MSLSDIERAALAYHAQPTPGKISLQITKPTESQADLALAYSPGVAAPVRAIVADPKSVYDYTAKGNLVGVISNGTAVLGLGDVGALASKPVMEGKAVLFKRFAGIDVFDIEVDAQDVSDFIDTVARISPTFGAINLEDIKAPECFAIEEALQSRLPIPVFHDDQHGTAVTVAAGLLNALEIQGKKLSDIKLVCLGAGAAGIASMNLLQAMGLPASQIWMHDRQGLITQDRSGLNRYKTQFAQPGATQDLPTSLRDADVFIGVSGANLMPVAGLMSMAPKPIVFALSNPDPEIDPAVAYAARSDLILATGRSDYPNQVNNVLCFPYIFKGALAVQAKLINVPMMMAAVEAIRALAHEPVPATVAQAYNSQMTFGTRYILPTPLDPRLLQVVAPAVAQAAIASGVAQKSVPSL